LKKLKEGSFVKRNPYSGKEYLIKTNNVRAIVFWTKNPKPFFRYIKEVEKIIPNFYFQFTLNYYQKNIEANLPDINKRIETFRYLSDLIGKEKVIWRFDPLLLKDDISVNDLIEKTDFIADKINSYTNKLVFSFVDILKYKRIKNTLIRNKIDLRELKHNEKKLFAQKLSSLASKYGITAATCAEEINLNKFGVAKNKCIDEVLFKKLFNDDKQLMNFLNDKTNLKDKGQRKECKCVTSKDIGLYNTCIHSCVYCYAVISKNSAINNYNKLNVC